MPVTPDSIEMPDEIKGNESTAPTASAPKPPAAAHPAPPKPAGPAPLPWESEMVATFRQHYGSGILQASSYLGQNFMVVDRSIAFDVLRHMRDDEQFDYCVDVTAVHYPEREQQ